MQVLITHGSLASSRVLHLSRPRLLALVAITLLALLMLSGLVYHFVFLKAAREGWPLVSPIVRLVVRDEIAQRDRYLRENLDAMAQKVGEMQAKLVKLEAMGERVSGLAGIKPEDLKPLRRFGHGGQGGPYVPIDRPSLDQLNGIVAGLDETVDLSIDVFMLAESRLLESKLRRLMIPSSAPVNVPVGSGFGFRPDPITGRPALHTGLDFPADVGTPVHAAAGGVVVAAEGHPQYGHLIEIDHGNGLLTRYAHNSKVLVKAGDIVRRDQPIAQVGNSGRSTGPHLHFEVLVSGSPQDPARFLAGTAGASTTAAAR